MKILRTLFAITLIAALFAVSSQANASAPASVEYKNTPPGQVKTPPGLLKTPGSNAPDKLNAEGETDKGNPHGKTEHFKGVLTAADETSITLTLDDGTSVTVGLTPETRIHVPGVQDATFETLLPEMKVMVKALRGEEDALTAKSIQVVPGKPVRTHNVGIVTAYVPGESISILAKDGETYEFLLTETTKILPAEREPLLVPGARVTIISPRVVSAVEMTATGIVVHPDAALGDLEAPDSTEPAETEEPVETVEPIDTVEPI